MDTTDRTLSIDDDQLGEMLALLRSNPTDILLSERCRKHLAKARWLKGGRQLRTLAEPSAGVMPGTVVHNRRELVQDAFSSSRRTQRLIGPLSGLDPVFTIPERLSALSIGPRTEMELLHLVGIGFKPENVRAIDLISSSPLMDVGDMHSLPYPDQSFNVVISGWVLTYSKDPARAVREMVRVCAPGGLIAIGGSSAPDYPAGYVADPKGEKEIVGSMVRRASEYADMIGSNLKAIHFQQDARGGDATSPVMLIARITH